MKVKIIIILYFGLIAPIAISQQLNEIPVNDPSSLLERVTRSSTATTSITANFTQEKDMSFMEEKVVSSGRFYFMKEKQMRWEYTEPFSYAIILNGDRFRIVDEGKSKDFGAGSNRMFVEISEVMTGMVNGTLLSSNKFNVTWFEAPGYYRAELVPVTAALRDYLSKVDLKLSKTDLSVDELKMFEKSGDYTLIIFRNKKLNEKIPFEIFRLD